MSKLDRKVMMTVLKGLHRSLYASNTAGGNAVEAAHGEELLGDGKEVGAFHDFFDRGDGVAGGGSGGSGGSAGHGDKGNGGNGNAEKATKRRPKQAEQRAVHV